VAEQAAQAGAARDSAAAEQSPADTLGQLLADELDDLAAAPGADTRPEASAPDDTDIFGTDLFGDLGADAFDAPQEQLADVVTSEGVGMPASTLGDLASLLEQDDATVTETGAEPPSEADDLMAALFDATTETPLPEEEEPPARPKTVPPPLPSDSVRPPALEAAVLEGARESFEDLSDELDLLEVDDYEIVIDETSMDDSNTTGTELDGPALTAAELEPGPSAALEQAPDATDTGEQGEEEPEEKKGFFKKLFG
jgi:hypothetical protein